MGHEKKPTPVEWSQKRNSAKRFLNKSEKIALTFNDRAGGWKSFQECIKVSGIVPAHEHLLPYGQFEMEEKRQQT